MSLSDNNEGRGPTLEPVRLLPPEGLPPTIDPEELAITKCYLLAILLPGGKYGIEGPFRPHGKIVKIRHLPPLTGQFKMNVVFEESSVPRKIMVPIFGLQALLGIQYSLHESSEETILHFRRHNQGVTSREDPNGSCWSTDDKYHG